MKKESVKNNKIITKPKKGFIWYSLRASFWLIALIWIFFVLTDKLFLSTGLDQALFSLILLLIWIVLIFFNFVVSIIHLTKYKEKAFAIVSLVFSSLLMLLFFVGFILGFVGSSIV